MYKYLTLDSSVGRIKPIYYDVDDALLTVGHFNQPLPCSTEFFIQAFILPIKHQLKDRMVILIDTDRQHFSLNYNNAHSDDDDDTSPEELARRRTEAADIRAKLLYHMDRIVDHMVGGDFYSDTVPFGTSKDVIRSVSDSHIRLSGRLPMQEDYFVRYYWDPLCKHYQKVFPGVRFNIHFGNCSRRIDITASQPRFEDYLLKHDIPVEQRQEVIRKLTAYQVKVVVTDLTELVIQACEHYEFACIHANEHIIPSVIIMPTMAIPPKKKRHTV